MLVNIVSENTVGDLDIFAGLPEIESRAVVHTNTGKQIEVVRFAGLMDYLSGQAAMQRYVANNAAKRDQFVDQIWLLQHPKTYTLGTACHQQPLAPSSIDVVHSDRGGQITYHGPGQVVMYPLLYLRRHGLGVKTLVQSFEQAAIGTLAEYGLQGQLVDGAPGVYLGEDKISALGLRIRRGVCYHGLSFNVDMDLAPFGNIDPCGYAGLKATRLIDHVDESVADIDTIGHQLVKHFCAQF